MKITVTATQNDKLKLISDCLSNTYLFGNVLSLRYSKSLYKTHSDALGDDVCHEDVLTDMIKSGAVIKVYDEEGGEYVGELSLNKIEANWGSIRSEDIMDVLKENDDSDTADNILQSLIFGDIIYG